MTDPAVVVAQLTRHFGTHRALAGVSLQVRPGEMVALLGASGSGKSTLLRHVAGLQRADAHTHSRVEVLGDPVQAGGRLSPEARQVRARVAMIFQQFNLVDRLPALTNVLAGCLHRMPAWRWALGRFPRHEQERAWAALCRVGIERCAHQRAGTLSGGQQQRAAISRALMQGAQVILADEPIASLDPEASRRVMELLAEVNREAGTTVLVSLHQVEYAFAYCPRTVALRAGEVVYDGPTRALDAGRLRALYGAQSDELLLPTGTPSAIETPPVPSVLQAA